MIANQEQILNTFSMLTMQMWIVGEQFVQLTNMAGTMLRLPYSLITASLLLKILSLPAS